MRETVEGTPPEKTCRRDPNKKRMGRGGEKKRGRGRKTKEKKNGLYNAPLREKEKTTRRQIRPRRDKKNPRQKKDDGRREGT